MKLFFSALLALVASCIPAFAITVASPSNGAQVSSPFTLVASTTPCGGVPAVSMGYSLDSGATTGVPTTSLSAKVTASAGAHVLKVKCWGKQTSGQTSLNITVLPAATGSNITVTSPANGAS